MLSYTRQKGSGAHPGPGERLLTLAVPGLPGVEQAHDGHPTQKFGGSPRRPEQAWWRLTASSVVEAARGSTLRRRRAPSFARAVHKLRDDADEKCTRRVALVLESAHGLDIVDQVSEVMLRSRGRLTLMYIADGRGPWLSSSLSPVAPIELTAYAVSWGETLLKHATARVPLDVPVSTQLLIYDYEKGRPEPISVLLRGGHDLVVFEQPRRSSKRFRNLIRDLAQAGVPAQSIDARESQLPH